MVFKFESTEIISVSDGIPDPKVILTICPAVIPVKSPDIEVIILLPASISPANTFTNLSKFSIVIPPTIICDICYCFF